MPKLIPFIATIRCVINSPDEVEANVTADRLRDLCMEWLDEEDGDDVRLTQVTASSSDLEPTETLVVLKRARNALIRTRIKECWELARELDKVCHILTKRGEMDQLLASYDYSKFMDLSADILQNHKDPID
jgi:hypothetical protein